MDLERISVEALGEEARKIVEAIRALPEGTIEGIPEYGFFKAYLLKRDGTIKIGNFDPTWKDEVLVNVPENADKVVRGKRKVSFVYSGNNYDIYFRRTA